MTTVTDTKRSRPSGGRRPVRETIRLNSGRRISMLRWPGRGRTLVALHGLLDSSDGWQGLATRSHRPVIAFDLPGFGSSDLHKNATVADYAADLWEAIDQHVGLAEFVLVGHSLGGAVATALAELAGEKRCHALCLVAPAGYSKQPIAELANQPIIKNVVGAVMPFMLANPITVSAAYLTMVAGGRLPQTSLLTRLAKTSRHESAGAMVAIRALALSDDGPSSFIRRPVDYWGPVTVIWGKRDRLLPHSDSERVRDAMPQTRIVLLERVAHHPQVEAPEVLDQAVEKAVHRRKLTQESVERRRAEAAKRRRLNAPRKTRGAKP